MTVVLLAILVVYVTMVYGPIAAWLVELFPTRIRYIGSVAALSHRQRLVRRLPAGDRVRHRGGDRQHLLRPVVSDRDSGDELRHRADLPARDQGSRHHRHVTERRGGCSRPPSTQSSNAPHLTCGAFFVGRGLRSSSASAASRLPSNHWFWCVAHQHRDTPTTRPCGNRRHAWRSGWQGLHHRS